MVPSRTVTGDTKAPEYLEGFRVVEAPDREAAVALATQASKVLGARIEVRAFREVPAWGVGSGEQHAAGVRQHERC